MSMRTLTILQFLGALAAYLGMTVVLPAILFHRKVRRENAYVRLLAYFVIGNFYLMNLVFLLELLHIANRYTLILFTAAPALFAGVRINQIPVIKNAVDASETAKRSLSGTIGFRLMLSNTWKALWAKVTMGLSKLFFSIRDNLIDWVGTITLVGLILWLYGSSMIQAFGYCSSDMVVHNYWINALGRNRIYVAGVYPQGFHAILYYIHAVFGIPTFVLMRVFGLVQTLAIHLVLFAFLKVFCRTRYIPYLGLTFYLFADVWNTDVYNRYYSALPQEFGMIFILPSAAFLMLFLSNRKLEKGAKGIKVHSTRYLFWFAMSFSMTLSVHFYNTMIAGVLCVAIAIGFVNLIFRKDYFWRILVTGILSIIIAVLPMATAYALGTPLEGSLRWGMSIIEGSSNKNDSAATEDKGTGGNAGNTNAGTNSGSNAGKGTTTGNSGSGGSGNAGTGAGSSGSGNTGAGTNAGTNAGGAPVVTQPKPPAPTLEQRWITLWTKVQKLARGLIGAIDVYVLNRLSQSAVGYILLLIPALALLAIPNLTLQQTRYYGSVLLSMACYMAFMCIMMIPQWFGLPALMDSSRCSIYFAYSLPIIISLCADGAISILTGWFSTAFVMNTASIAGAVALAALLVFNGKGREPRILTPLETNGAIIALTNILRDNRDWTFTICSANDELRMVEDYGYHYEAIALLREMEGKKEKEYLKIPTPKIYVFVEKIPLDYMSPYEGSGSFVSEEAVYERLPVGSTLSIYKGRNRYIVMSKLYRWAQVFQDIYPSEMKIYYETDNFVCYEIEQNPYRLFDLSINYKYPD